MAVRGLAQSWHSAVRFSACCRHRRSLATLAKDMKSGPKQYVDYEKIARSLDVARNGLKRPLTLAEKIVYGHLANPETASHIVRGQSWLALKPDRVAMQDASAQMALLQFMTCGLPSSVVPASIHCDHLIQAKQGAAADLSQSMVTNKEVFDFLESAAKKYGIAFWKPGSGIIHQIVLENYATPGALMLGTDSHTPNAGGLGVIAIGVGGADAVDAMTDTPWEVMAPKVIGVKLTGEMQGWTSAKDLILHLAGKLTVRGGTGHIIEYYGPGVQTLSATGMATICNMGAEVGATTSVFPFGENMANYLSATRRDAWAKDAHRAAANNYLSADTGCEYDQHIEVNLNELECTINGPFTPDLATPLTNFKAFMENNAWSDTLHGALIGSCTNSSYEDMTRVASIARQAAARGLKAKTPFLVTPGSEQINATIKRDGITDILESVGATVLANACGPCIGQWNREDYKGQENNILTSFNRNFKSRNDGNPQTRNFLASPEIVTAMSFAGTMSFDPRKDELIGADGKPFKFDPPQGDYLPSQGFDLGNTDYLPSAETSVADLVTISIDPASKRLQALAPFPAWDRLDAVDLPVLVKCKGKVTTDTISAAGPWLAYKGHIGNLSHNTLMTALNADTDRVNEAFNQVTGETQSIPEVAFSYRDHGIRWVYVSDENTGEGSAREHAAIQPRFLGAVAVIARSFARIHEVNLKKQGVLPLTFEKKSDYDLVTGSDKVTLKLSEWTEVSRPIDAIVTKPDGRIVSLRLHHTISPDQRRWWEAGSALNALAKTTNNPEVQVEQSM